MKALILLLSVLLFAISCGGGGGSAASSSSEPENSFRFKSSEADTFQGVWYGTQCSFNGVQAMPTDLRELKWTINADGSWSMVMSFSSLGSTAITEIVTTSENEGKGDNGLQVTSFSYLEERGSIIISETFLDLSDGSESTLGLTIIKDDVENSLVGEYTLVEVYSNGYSSTVFLSGGLSISSNGDAIFEYNYTDGTSNIFPVHLAGQNSKYFIQGAYKANEVGGYSFVGNLLTLAGTNHVGETYTTIFEKI